MPKHCPRCGGFLVNTSKEVWARNHDGSKVLIRLSGERCNQCDHKRTESYFVAVKRLGLAPWGNRPPGESPTHYDPERQAEIDRCYQGCKRRGRVCAGCHNDVYCQMPRDSYKWMVEFFAPLLK